MGPRSLHEITGLVLAGGQGRRMGGADKGWVDYADRPLILTVIERFSPQVGTLLISANRNIERYRAIAGVSQVIADTEGDFDGPVAGVLSALAHVETPWLAIVPCDAPQLPLDLVERLAHGLANRRAACVRNDELLQPVFALVSSELQPLLRRFYDSGGRSMKAWLETLDVAAVDFDDHGAFRNVNAIVQAGPAP